MLIPNRSQSIQFCGTDLPLSVMLLIYSYVLLKLQIDLILKSHMLHPSPGPLVFPLSVDAIVISLCQLRRSEQSSAMLYLRNTTERELIVRNVALRDIVLTNEHDSPS
jgi:hypothetical protein